MRIACHSCSRSSLSLKRVISSSAANGSSIKQQFRLGDERARDRDAHVHAAGKFARIGLARNRRARRAAASPRRAARPRPRATPCSLQRQPDVVRRRSPTASASAPGTRSRCGAGGRPRRCPAIRPCRAVGSLSPAMMRSAVDLPQPDGPSSDRNSPGAHVEIEPVERQRAVRKHLRRRHARRRAGCS